MAFAMTPRTMSGPDESTRQEIENTINFLERKLKKARSEDKIEKMGIVLSRLEVFFGKYEHLRDKYLTKFPFLDKNTDRSAQWAYVFNKNSIEESIPGYNESQIEKFFFFVDSSLIRVVDYNNRPNVIWKEETSYEIWAQEVVLGGRVGVLNSFHSKVSSKNKIQLNVQKSREKNNFISNHQLPTSYSSFQRESHMTSSLQQQQPQVIYNAGNFIGDSSGCNPFCPGITFNPPSYSSDNVLFSRRTSNIGKKQHFDISKINNGIRLPTTPWESAVGLKPTIDTLKLAVKSHNVPDFCKTSCIQTNSANQVNSTKLDECLPFYIGSHYSSCDEIGGVSMIYPYVCPVNPPMKNESVDDLQIQKEDVILLPFVTKQELQEAKSMSLKQLKIVVPGKFNNTLLLNINTNKGIYERVKSQIMKILPKTIDFTIAYGTTSSNSEKTPTKRLTMRKIKVSEIELLDENYEPIVNDETLIGASEIRVKLVPREESIVVSNDIPTIKGKYNPKNQSKTSLSSGCFISGNMSTSTSTYSKKLKEKNWWLSWFEDKRDDEDDNDDGEEEEEIVTSTSPITTSIPSKGGMLSTTSTKTKETIISPTSENLKIGNIEPVVFQILETKKQSLPFQEDFTTTTSTSSEVSIPTLESKLDSKVHELPPLPIAFGEKVNLGPNTIVSKPGEGKILIIREEEAGESPLEFDKTNSNHEVYSEFVNSPIEEICVCHQVIKVGPSGEIINEEKCTMESKKNFEKEVSKSISFNLGNQNEKLEGLSIPLLVDIPAEKISQEFSVLKFQRAQGFYEEFMSKSLQFLPKIISEFTSLREFENFTEKDPQLTTNDTLMNKAITALVYQKSEKQPFGTTNGREKQEEEIFLDFHSHSHLDNVKEMQHHTLSSFALLILINEINYEDPLVGPFPTALDFVQSFYTTQQRNDASDEKSNTQEDLELLYVLVKISVELTGKLIKHIVTNENFISDVTSAIQKKQAIQEDIDSLFSEDFSQEKDELVKLYNEYQSFKSSKIRNIEFSSTVSVDEVLLTPQSDIQKFLPPVSYESFQKLKKTIEETQSKIDQLEDNLNLETEEEQRYYSQKLRDIWGENNNKVNMLNWFKHSLVNIQTKINNSPDFVSTIQSLKIMVESYHNSDSKDLSIGGKNKIHQQKQQQKSSPLTINSHHKSHEKISKLWKTMGLQMAAGGEHMMTNQAQDLDLESKLKNLSKVGNHYTHGWSMARAENLDSNLKHGGSKTDHIETKLKKTVGDVYFLGQDHVKGWHTFVSKDHFKTKKEESKNLVDKEYDNEESENSVDDDELLNKEEVEY